MSISELDAHIVYAECGCPAGRGPCGSCKHIAAFAYALEEFSRFGLYRELDTCTSKLQEWNKPRRKKLEPRCLYEISFKRQKLQEDKPENYCTKCGLKPFQTQYSELPVADRYVNQANKKLRSIVKSTLPSAAIVHCLHEDDCLDEPDKADENNMPNCDTAVHEGGDTNTNSDITTDISEDQVTKLMDSLKIPVNRITEIETETRCQNACDKWYELCRLTASYFGKICGKNLSS